MIRGLIVLLAVVAIAGAFGVLTGDDTDFGDE